MKHDFTPPESLSEAKERLLVLTKSVLQIQSQLSFPERRNPDGTTMTHGEHASWRAKALRKLSEMQIEATSLRHWITERRVSVAMGRLTGDEYPEPAILLSRARALLSRHRDRLEGVDELGDLLEGIDLYLQHRA